jgi:HlyD family secretion protein
MSRTNDREQSEASRALWRLTLFGGASVALFAGTIGVWAVSTTLSGAVVAFGQFVVDGNVKKVQHQTGGVVGELHVREGDRVSQGQVVIRLDDTLTRSNLQIVSMQLDEFAARRARLQAERDGKTTIVQGAELEARQNERAIAELVTAEQNLFEARRLARNGQKAQLLKRVAQLRDEIGGLKAQQVARDRQAELIEEELAGVRGLYEKSLVALNRKTALEREAANLDGQKGRLIAAVAQSEGRIAETELQIIQIDEVLREEVVKELREIQSRSAELTERRVAAEDQLKRVEIKAPITGFVHQLSAHTVGGVIAPGEATMLIVPAEDTLQLEARINPPDIDQIALDRPAQVKIQAFNQRTTPELRGQISRISPDSSRDQQTGATFYTIRISIPPAEYARLAPQRIFAGMQAEAFIRTEDRSPWQYIIKPLKDQVSKAFRER